MPFAFARKRPVWIVFGVHSRATRRVVGSGMVAVGFCVSVCISWACVLSDFKLNGFLHGDVC